MSALALRAPAPFAAGTAAPRRQVAQQRGVRLAARAQQQPEQPAAQQAEQGAAPGPAPNTCPTCGVPMSDKAFGCDGSGRIAGGIGAVPGFGWWPIKAYRPCPKAGAAGVVYKRKGQITDEVLFGKGRQ